MIDSVTFIVKTRKCRDCGIDKPYAEMKSKGKSKVTGEPLVSNICRVCDNKRVNKARSANLKHRKVNIPEGRYRRKRGQNSTHYLYKKYGLTPEIVDDMKNSQMHLCAICGLPKRLVVDHCHESGLVRDLLCAPCNKMIGMANDDIGILERAIEYLRKHADKKNAG